MVNQHQKLAVERHLVWMVVSPLFLAHYTPTTKQRTKALMDTMIKAPVLVTMVKAPIDIMVRVLMDTMIKAPMDIMVKAPIETMIKAPIDIVVKAPMRTMVHFTVRVPVVHTATVLVTVLPHH